MIGKLITKKRLVIAILLIVIGFAVYNYFFASSKTKNGETARVKKGTLEEKLTISGTVDAEEKVTLRFQTSGRLTWVGVKEGDYVGKYQSIASLDPREVKKKLQKELNDYLNQRGDFDQKNKDDYRDKVMTDTIKRILDKAQNDLNNSVLDVEIQNLSVEYANLWTPIEGIVTKITSPYAGTNIIPTQAEFEIINPNSIFFEASADQSEVTKLYQGMTGELILDAYPQTSQSGTINNISFIPKSGEAATVYLVKFIFNPDNSDYKYRIGMGGDLTFILKKKEDVLYTPAKYIKSDNGKKFVKVKEQNQELKKYVETGMETDNEVEITSGLNEGETVVN